MATLVRDINVLRCYQFREFPVFKKIIIALLMVLVYNFFTYSRDSCVDIFWNGFNTNRTYIYIHIYITKLLCS